MGATPLLELLALVGIRVNALDGGNVVATPRGMAAPEDIAPTLQSVSKWDTLSSYLNVKCSFCWVSVVNHCDCNGQAA